MFYLIAGYAKPFFQVLRVDRYFGPFMFVVLASEVIAVGFIIFFTVQEIRKFYKQRMKYFEVTVLCQIAFVGHGREIYMFIN